MGKEDTEEFEAIPRSRARVGRHFRSPASEGHGRLSRESLGTVEVAASTMANMAPAMSFFFSFAFIATASGLASPLVIIVAAAAIAILGNTLAEFTRSTPSAGSFVTFIGKSFGPVAASATALVLSLGYVIAISAVVVISGAWFNVIVSNYLHFSIPWEIYTVIFVAAAGYAMYRGVRISTRLVAALLGLEIAILVLVALGLLVKHHQSISLAPFNPGNLRGGLSGLWLGFPLAVFMFIGWENSASLAEETSRPRQNVPMAIFVSVAIMAFVYVFLSYATEVGFGNNIGAATSTGVPLLDAARGLGGVMLFLAYLAGMTSILAALISGANSQSRIVFSSAREGLLPTFAARLSHGFATPWASIALLLGISMGISLVFGAGTDPLSFFGEVATLGTILVSLVYLVSNLALPVYYQRYHPESFHVVRHLVLPMLGALAIGFPLYELIKPGQSAPFDYFPYISLAIVAAAVGYAIYLNRKDPGVGERVGSIVADSD